MAPVDCGGSPAINLSPLATISRQTGRILTLTDRGLTAGRRVNLNRVMVNALWRRRRRRGMEPGDPSGFDVQGPCRILRRGPFRIFRPRDPGNSTPGTLSNFPAGDPLEFNAGDPLEFIRQGPRRFRAGRGRAEHDRAGCRGGSGAGSGPVGLSDRLAPALGAPTASPASCGLSAAGSSPSGRFRGRFQAEFALKLRKIPENTP